MAAQSRGPLTQPCLLVPLANPLRTAGEGWRSFMRTTRGNSCYVRTCREPGNLQWEPTGKLSRGAACGSAAAKRERGTLRPGERAGLMVPGAGNIPVPDGEIKDLHSVCQFQAANRSVRGRGVSSRANAAPVSRRTSRPARTRDGPPGGPDSAVFPAVGQRLRLLRHLTRWASHTHLHENEYWNH